jgi:hypothetical protein
MKYEIKWHYDEEQEALDMIYAHISSFFEGEGCKVLIEKDFETVTIKKGSEDYEVERLVEVFNKGHSFNSHQPHAERLPLDLKIQKK